MFTRATMLVPLDALTKTRLVIVELILLSAGKNPR